MKFAICNESLTDWLFDLAYVRLGYLPILGIAVIVSGILKA